MAYQINYTGQTTNATPKEIFQIDGTRFAIAHDATFRLRGTAVAQDATTIDSKEWSFSILIKNVDGTVSIVDYTAPTSADDDASLSACTIALTADDTNDALAVTVTGIAATTINWSLGFDFDSIGYTPTVATVATKLSVPQIVDLIKLHHPKVPYTTMAQMLSTAQTKFIAASKLNSKRSTILMTGQTLVGTTKAAPLVLTDTDGVYSWSFYKDTTTDTVTLKSSASVMFYSGIACVDSSGEAVNEYSIVISDDKTIRFYDIDGEELTDFDDTVAYMSIEFVKNPDILTVVSTSVPEIQAEYHEALAHYVISDLYMARTDLPMIDRLQASKHYKNLYDEYELKAKYAYNMQSNTFSVASIVSSDFRE
jgi:hypothetical protein